MATARQYIEAASRYIGVSGTDNIFNTWIWGFHCYDPNTYPWCAAFQSYVGVHDLGMPFNPSASAAGVGWQGVRVADSDVQPGDWVLFNWDGSQDFGWAQHIGLVEWFDHSSGYFGTIEGNTGGGEGSVMRCTRYNWGGYATAFFRPPYDGWDSGGRDYDEEEDEMTVWGYKNEEINGSRDAYALLTETHRNTAALADKMSALASQVSTLNNKVAVLSDKIAALDKKTTAIDKTVKNIKVGGVDTAAVAKAVNDDAANRMKK